MWVDFFLWSLYFVALYFSIFLLSIFLFEPKVHLKDFKVWPKVSIIIPAWNEEICLTETIESVLAIDYPKKRLEVIVVDHGSTDKTGEIADSYNGQVFVLHLKRGLKDNKAVAINAALKRVSGEFVACLDADSVVEPAALKEMLPYFDADEVAVVTPIMLVKTPKNLLQKLQKYEYIVSILIKRIAAFINCIYVAPGPFSIYRTKILKQLGGFDEAAIAEDMEIVYRIQKENYVAKQCLHGGRSYAEAPKSLKDLYAQRKRWYGGSISNLYQYRQMTLNKDYGDFGFFQMPRNIFGIFAAIAALFFFGYYFALPIAQKLRDFFLISFDIMPIVSQYKFELTLFQLKNIPSIFIVSITILISLFFFFYAFYDLGERFNRRHVFPLVIFFLAYPIILCCIYLAVITQKIFGHNPTWQKVAR
ncbi:glycosyltransferase family 2 protein [Candidatus Woesearchaeota archaeon]|nr:glycosyltransferase family 2 protein [Candidatus Woesearchaeota archaeon]